MNFSVVTATSSSVRFSRYGHIDKMPASDDNNGPTLHQLHGVPHCHTAQLHMNIIFLLDREGRISEEDIRISEKEDFKKCCDHTGRAILLDRLHLITRTTTRGN
jgi:hypothetical protein